MSLTPLIFTLILTSQPKGWSWYSDGVGIDTTEQSPPVDTSYTSAEIRTSRNTENQEKSYWEKLIAQNPGDTVQLDYLYAMSRMGLLPFDKPLVLQDPLPIEPNTPEPIRRLLLHPNRENARKFISWMSALFLRAHVISKLVADVGREYGLEDFMGVSVRAANDSLRKIRINRLKSLEEKFVILIFAGDDVFSKYAIENLKSALDIENLNMPVVVVQKEPLSESIKSVIPASWFVKYDEGEYESLDIFRVPTVVGIDMKKKRVHYVSRVPVPASEYRKRLENLLYEEGNPILFNLNISSKGVMP